MEADCPLLCSEYIRELPDLFNNKEKAVAYRSEGLKKLYEKKSEYGGFRFLKKYSGRIIGIDSSSKVDPRIMNKVDRNALCPCGSGKKYKKCCGRNV